MAGNVESKTGVVENLQANAKARFLQAKQMFAETDPSITPSSEMLIKAHEDWLNLELKKIGVDGKSKSLYQVFRNAEIPDKRHKSVLRKLEIQSKLSVANILRGLLWYEAPEFSSWNKLNLKFVSKNCLQDQEALVKHMKEHQRIYGWKIDDWNSPEKHKSLVVGFKLSEENIEAPFTFQVNEHYPGVRGQFNYTDSKRKFIGVKAIFNPISNLFEIDFEDPTDFIGWDEIEGEKSIYKLTDARNLIRDLYSKIKSEEKGIIKISTWRAY